MKEKLAVDPILRTQGVDKRDFLSKGKVLIGLILRRFIVRIHSCNKVLIYVNIGKGLSVAIDMGII